MKHVVVFTLILLASVFSTTVFAQGCVAIRQMSSCGSIHLESNLLQKGDLQLLTSYRYFESFRHFRGTEEEPDRVANNTEVINHSHGIDVSLNYGISKRLYGFVSLPFVINQRSSLYEHGRMERNSTFSRGMGDVRLGVGYWVFDPDQFTTGNLAFGLGVKLPTGSYNASDIFYNVGAEGTPQVRPVDQSIQPGDGGFGFSLDVQFYKSLGERFSVYGNGLYLFNPRETNGVRTFRETLSPILENEAIMSVADQFQARIGMAYGISPFVSGSLGMRYEGIPVEDIIGGSEGFRRPGNVLSLEPGLSYMKDNFNLSLSVPIALRRERPQSVTDIESSEATGEFRNGDSAFADYSINLGLAYTFRSKKNTVMDEHATPTFPILD